MKCESQAILPVRAVRAVRAVAVRHPLSAALMLLGMGASGAAWAAPPPSLDDQLRAQLALGNNVGCASLFAEETADGTGLEDAMRDLAAQGKLGNELRAICGPSAVASASSLGGALNSAQATKTVSQFRLARRRIDQRLQRRNRVTLSDLMLYAAPPEATSAPDPVLYEDRPSGFGVFGEVEYEDRERERTALEDGYNADVAAATVGLDRAWDRVVAGAWLGHSRTRADLAGGGALVTGGPALAAQLADPRVLAAVCGGVGPGGRFDIEGPRAGAFVAWNLGESAFVDLGFSRERRDLRYRRGVCAIEASNTPLSVKGDVVFADGDDDGIPDDNEIVDDIFAGTLHGRSRTTEDRLSLRVGADWNRGAWIFSPRAILSYSRSRTDGFTETGRSSVANPVESAGKITRIDRVLGGPIGFELVYPDRRERITQLELGGEIGRRFDFAGTSVIGYVSGYWRKQNGLEDPVVRVRLAQDKRDRPTYFSFATNAVDADTAQFSLGAIVLLRNRMNLRFEASYLAYDELIDSTSFSVQFRYAL